MDAIFNKFRVTAIGLLLGICASLPAVAEDIEIYTDVSLGAATVKPNVMFIIDSSASMLVTNTPDAAYDPSVTYDAANSCTFGSGRVYYSFDGSIPGCGSTDYFDEDALKCDNAYRQYKLNPDTGLLELLKDSNNVQVPGSFLTHGTYSDRFAQFTGRNLYKWRVVATSGNASSSSRSLMVECKQDSGLHGASDGVFYIADKPVATSGWDSQPMTGDPANSHGLWAENGTIGTIYHYNYLNYLNQPAPAAAPDPVSLFDQVKDVIIQSTIGQTGINIGLMQYDTSSNASGGAVQYPIEDVTASRGNFGPAVRTMNAGGSSSISETYYEALKYFGGRDVDFAADANPGNVGSSMGTGNNNYVTPITSTCQKNYIIALSDGIPDQDYVSEARQGELPGFTVGSCNTAPDDFVDWNKNPDIVATDDNCLDELSEWAANKDIAYQSGNTAHEGMQNITTFTVGFNIPADLADGSPLKKAVTLLKATAKNGDGKYYEARDSAELAAKIAEIFSGILEVNSTFSSPAVSVNAFNRATNLDDLFFTLFKPKQLATGVSAARWQGNLKKFKLEFDANRQPFVADVNHTLAIDSNTGFFVDTSQSYWTPAADAPDGAETAKGGAASRMTFPRNLYTYTGGYQGNRGILTTSGSSDLTVATNKFNRGNTSVSDALLDIVDYPPLIGNDSYKYSLLSWAIGKDVFDDDGDDDTTDDRREMGDPLHAEPALIQYGLLSDNITADVVSYVATNDGYLHAFDGNTGAENFAFVPQELLPKLQYIFNDTGANGKAYGLDGNVVAWINDANSDGDLLDANDHVYLYFGMRRGGHYIYSLDVTDRHVPKLRWIIEGGTGDYAELGQTWSAPNVEKIKTGTGVDDYKIVLLFGAGYDTAQDVSTSTRDSTAGDSIGRGVFIADAETGEVLWSAGPAGTDSLQLSDMKYSIPARIKPLDVDGDGFVDQFYAGDLGGQLWRFDIDNASNTTNSLAITGGRIADLATDGSLIDNRRFYNPPDVALTIEEGRAPYLSIVAASGYRAHPLQTDTHDRAYMIRDYDVYTAPAAYTTVTEADLFDTTDNTIGDGTQLEVDAAKLALGTSKGWYITFKEANGLFVGEKALSEPLIFGGVAVFTTYIPASAGLTSNSCTANDGSGRIYFVNTVDGTPTGDANGDGLETEADRSVLLARGGIPPTPRIIITEDGIPTLCVGTECSKAGEVGTVQKMYWYEVEE